MKGTKVLIMGETYNQQKAFLWSYIHTCQELIKALQASKLANSSLARDVIQENRLQIRDTYAELKKLLQWFKKSGLKEDEPYYPESYKKWLESLTDEQWEERLNKAEILRQLQEKYELERG
jgi:hypothetical protein